MNVVAHNMLAMNAYRQYNIRAKDSKKTSEKLASGYKINRAADDAAGLSISEKMRNLIRGLNQGTENIQDGMGFVQTGDGAMGELHAIIGRIRELAVQGANDVNSDEDRKAINDEIQQLKSEINTIADRTKFNGINVFHIPKIELGIGVQGVPDDLNTFNASYDSATRKVTYGGFIFNGQRITWDRVHSNMVSVDGEGNQIFNGGDYVYNSPDGTSFAFSCNQGDSVPIISRTVRMTATDAGIHIDGTAYTWDALKDENGNGMSSSSIHKGVWSMSHKGADLAFFVSDEVKSISDMVEAVNDCHDGEIKYTWKVDYEEPQEVPAVRNATTSIEDVLLSNKLAKEISSGEISLTLKADNIGMWLQNDTGKDIAGSKKTWNEIGISSFISGSSINEASTYQYSYSFANVPGAESQDDIKITFRLSEVTSVDSIIDGLDGMKFEQTSYTPNHSVRIDNDSEIGELKNKQSTIKVTPGDEIAFGRDFEIKQVSNVASASPKYDATAKTVSVDFVDGSNKTVIGLSGGAGSVVASLERSLNQYAARIEANKTTAALKGIDPQANENIYTDLRELVGDDHITTTGYMSELVTLREDMIRSDDFDCFPYAESNGEMVSQNKYGKVGGEYPAGKIDFSGLGTSYTLDDLRNLGFDSTCRTCSQHYSVKFVKGLIGTAETTEDGYSYSVSESIVSGRGNRKHYTMEIDIDSLKTARVITGAEFTKALVSMLRETKLDEHYSQYIGDGSVLYVCDNRGSAYTIGSITDAAFYTSPYDNSTLGEYTFNMKQNKDADASSTLGGSTSLTYSFDYKTFENSILVNMEQDNDGEYVKLGDGSYIHYDSEKHSGIDPSSRYNVGISYKAVNGTALSTLDEAISDYSTYAIKDMVENTTFTIDNDNYMKFDLKANALPSTAIRSTYQSYVDSTPYEDVIRIQNSGIEDDFTKIPRYSMNTVSMGIFDANTLTREQAENTIQAADRAEKYVASCRGMYGALQNRLEKTYNNNQNYSENLTGAESLIRDTDMAKEVTKDARNRMLLQAAQAMLAQANDNNSDVLKIMQQF